jgi:hypothetical protein
MLTHHIFGELRRVARCGLGATGQPDTAIVQHSYDKRKGQGLGPGFAPPGGGVKGGGIVLVSRNSRNRASGFELCWKWNFLGENFAIAI